MEKYSSVVCVEEGTIVVNTSSTITEIDWKSRMNEKKELESQRLATISQGRVVTHLNCLVSMLTTT